MGCHPLLPGSECGYMMELVKLERTVWHSERTAERDTPVFVYSSRVPAVYFGCRKSRYVTECSNVDFNLPFFVAVRVCSFCLVLLYL